MKRTLAVLTSMALLVVMISGGVGAAPKKQVLRFYYPVGVAGPLAKAVGDLCDEFNSSQSEVLVDPIYSGGYAETMQRCITAAKSGNPPDIAVMTGADMWVSIDADIIIPLQPFIDKSGGDSFISPFYQAFLNDCEISGQIYGIPFQKSTPIFYYNKDMFREAGLDPNSGPKDWNELVEYAKKLTVRKGNTVTRWGLEIPVDQWIYTGMIMQAGGTISNKAGNRIALNTPEGIEALSFMKSLAMDYKVMPSRRLFGDSSADFVAGKTAMMYNSTGNLTFVRQNATFDWGVSFLPAGKVRAVPTGGGHLVVFNGISRERQEAAWKFITWLTSPANAAKWSVASGYVPVRKDAFNVAEMKQYVARYPQALVARDQLQYARREEPASHEGRQISQLITVMLESVLAGNEKPSDALNGVQNQIDTVLAPFAKK